MLKCSLSKLGSYNIKDQEEKSKCYMYKTYFTMSWFLLFQSFVSLFVFSPSVLLFLWLPPFPLLLLLCLHLLLPPSEQTAAKSLNIPNIQRNPGRSLSPSVWLCVARSHICTGIHMSLCNSLSSRYTQQSACLSLFSPSGWGVNETKFTGNKTIELKHKPQMFLVDPAWVLGII